MTVTVTFANPFEESILETARLQHMKSVTITECRSPVAYPGCAVCVYSAAGHHVDDVMISCEGPLRAEQAQIEGTSYLGHVMNPQAYNAVVLSFLAKHAG